MTTRRGPRRSRSEVSHRCSVLRALSLEPGTVKQYRRALDNFLTFCYDYHETCHDLFELDAVLCEYLVDLHDSDASLSAASNTVNAVKFFLPMAKYNLPDSTLLLRGWHKSTAKQSRPPLTQELATVIAVSLLKAGHVSAAVATLLAFDCYLRIGEFCNMRVGDVARSHQLRFGSAFTGMVVGLAKTKTGVNQSVTVEDSLVQRLVEWYMSVFHSASRSATSLFGLTPARYRHLFHSACHSLRISAHAFSPHSLRHGGATRDFCRGRPLEDILLRGRWAASKSARTYIQSGRMLLISVDQTALQRSGADIRDDRRGQSLLDFFANAVTV